ncbi:MAG: chemotaxis response regulator protein-glutamate methylesterase [Acidobacteria bacterium]|nr:chemotaxis response regulator protein-glutamate methylesterase [Acidobacteriota bacterium]MBI3662958.1 chemotaxis response regulator protein-glutamate methylesterase [Acidobacteriota bacterium]
MATLTNSPGPIRVLVVDDSAFMRTAITRMVGSDPALQVIGTANDGLEALEKVRALNPDVLTMDIEMPRMDGLSALRRLMAESPRPVIMISSLTQEGAESTLTAFEIGAFDCIPKQLSYASLDIVKIREQLIEKIKAAAGAPHFRKPRAVVPAPPPRAPIARPPASHFVSVVAIGTSTGGPKALQQILPMLPADLPVGVVIVQHMPSGFTGPFAKRLDGLCKVNVREATQDEEITSGKVLIAPAGQQLTVYRRAPARYAVRLSHTPTDTPHIPSVDVMMLSVAEAYGATAMGIILTGMGGDGAEGMKKIMERGGLTVGQDEASCAVYGMPRTCAERGVLKHVVPLDYVPEEILHATRYANHSAKSLKH